MLTIRQVLTALLCCIAVSDQILRADEWPQWRGPLGTGGAPDGNPPIEWSEQQNIRWKTRLPGTGYATPVIWGNDIFISAAVPPNNYSSPGRGERPSHSALRYP